METLHILILALVQGLTEFLPISSSAHLILVPQVFGFADQGLAFDVAVHLGSLLAVIGYFRHELRVMTADFFRSLSHPDQTTEDARLLWLVILATLPIVLGGLLFKSLVEHDLRTPLVIASTTIIFGLALYWSDVRGRHQHDEHTLGWRGALLIGVSQVLALIPGTSRSGITMTAGLMLGLSRQAASRFSFLLAIPTIMMSGALVSLDLIQGTAPVDWQALSLGVVLSFIAAYLCIHYFLKFIERVGMLPFVLYRLLLGALILGFAWS